MLKKPSITAAASEEARRTLAVRRVSERCENKAGGLFQYPARAGSLSQGMTPTCLDDAVSVNVLTQINGLFSL